jgi:hypothetical protein
MDLITQLPKTKSGHDAIIVFVDKFSKMVHYAATTTTCTADEVAKIFFDTVVRLHGIPRSIVSDRDPRFTSKFWQELWKLCGTRLKMSTAYHPQTDGQTERSNRTLEDILRHYVSAKQDDWDEHLTSAEIAVNSSIQSSTGFTPYYLNYGENPVFPTLVPLEAVKNDTLYEVMRSLQQGIEQAKLHMERARERQTHYANRHRREFSFKEGEEVWLSTQNLKLPHGITKKLSSKYTGPFKVLEVVSPVAFKLQLPASWKIHSVFHISWLKKYVPNSDTATHEEIEIEENQQVEYVVDKIIGKRLGKDAQMEYLVLWKGYPESEATWESHEVVKDLAALDEFEQITASAVSSRVHTKVNAVWRKWTKNNVQQYIMTLDPPPEANITTTELSKIMKKHHVNGEKLTELTRELLVEMGLSPQAAEWFENRLDKMFSIVQ